jgi:cytochrome c553
MKKTTTAVAAIAALVMGSTAFATMDIMKAYKKDKDPKATCNSCHAKPAKGSMPTKGDAELNDLGKKVKAAEGKDKAIDWSKIPAVEQK